jgi:hypothetical protein
MSKERWRMAGDDDRDKRFMPPLVNDDDLSDYDDDFGFEEQREEQKMNVAKAWGVVIGSILSFAFFAVVVSLVVMFGLGALGLSLTYIEALVVSLCFFGFRFVDFVFVQSLSGRRNK